MTAHYRWASRAPIAASVLMEYSTVGHIYRMWREHSALGQNLTSWAAVVLALGLYSYFYTVCTPDQKWARRACWLSTVVCSAAFFTVLHFRV